MAKVSSEEIDAYVERRWPLFLEDLARLVSIDSSLDDEHAAPAAPFGPGPRAALDEMLAIAARMGLEVADGDGYAGYADLPGSEADSQQVAVIGHVDVVPAAQGWTFPPFALTEKDGILVGRGVADDKGPLLCALYALAFWMESGVSLRHAIRFIFGCNEETGMKEIPYYLERNDPPAFLFTPDAEFPLCHGEKGLFGCTVKASVPKGAIVSFDGGSASNAVPARAHAVVRCAVEDVPAAEGIEVERVGEGEVSVVAHGRGAHASLPDGGVNAIARLASVLSRCPACTDDERAFMAFAAEQAFCIDGSAAGVAASDEVFASLTSVVGRMASCEEGYFFTVDVRFPTSIDAVRLEEAYRGVCLSHGARIEVTRAQEPFVVDPDSAAVRALTDAYREQTGRPSVPFTMGGATYAREFPRAVSFGAGDASFALPSWVGGMHGADEGMSEESLKSALAVYIRAFGNLAEVEDVSS